MLEQAEEMIGEPVAVTLADGGYHTAANLAAGEQRGDPLVMPERYHPGVQGPYFKDKFVYDPDTDSYRKNGNITGPFRVYRAPRRVCWSRPAYGVCTKDAHTGRALWIGPSDALLRQHRHWMTTERARACMLGGKN